MQPKARASRPRQGAERRAESENGPVLTSRDVRNVVAIERRAEVTRTLSEDPILIHQRHSNQTPRDAKLVAMSTTLISAPSLSSFANKKPDDPK